MSEEDIVRTDLTNKVVKLVRSKGVYLAYQEMYIDFQNEQARRALEWAKMGDWDALAQHFRGGGKITMGIASFIADVLEGRRRPANRAQTDGARAKLVRLVCRVHELMKSKGLNQSSAIDEVAEQERISRRTVERALEQREYALRVAEEQSIASDFQERGRERLRALRLGKRSVVSDAGLSSWQGVTGPRH